MSSESPQKVTPVSPDKKPDRRRKSSVRSEASSQPDSLSARSLAPTPESSPLPIRLPTKCKPKTDSESDSDSTKSTKSSTSSTSKVSKVFKKTFKGKAIAIVKPFSNAVTEKKSSPNEKQKEIEERLNLYEFGSEQESDENNLNKESLQDSSGGDAVSLSLSKSSSAVSSLKGIKRLKSGRQASLSSRRLKSSPELKSVRVRVEKLRNSPQPAVRSDRNKVRQHLVQPTEPLAQSQLNQLETSPSSEKEEPSSCSQSETSRSSSSSSPTQDAPPDGEKSLEKVFNDCDSQIRSGTSGTEPVEQGEAVACKLEVESVESQSHIPTSQSQPAALGDSVKLASSGGEQVVLLNNDKIREIVKSELFSHPHPIKKEPVKLEKSDLERNEDSCSLQRTR